MAAAPRATIQTPSLWTSMFDSTRRTVRVPSVRRRRGPACRCPPGNPLVAHPVQPVMVSASSGLGSRPATRPAGRGRRRWPGGSRVRRGAAHTRATGNSSRQRTCAGRRRRRRASSVERRVDACGARGRGAHARSGPRDHGNRARARGCGTRRRRVRGRTGTAIARDRAACGRRPGDRRPSCSRSRPSGMPGCSSTAVSDAHVVGARRAGEHTRARGDCENMHRCPQPSVDERAPAAEELHDGDFAAGFVLVGRVATPARSPTSSRGSSRAGPARRSATLGISACPCTRSSPLLVSASATRRRPAVVMPGRRLTTANRTARCAPRAPLTPV